MIDGADAVIEHNRLAQEYGALYPGWPYLAPGAAVPLPAVGILEILRAERFR
ncbi:MAG: hypothetical protein ACRDL1_04525 [Solirubrobacterales bacterium]